MKRHLGILAVALAVASVAACGNGAPTATTNQAGNNAMAGAAPSASGMAGDAMANGTAAAGDAMAGGDNNMAGGDAMADGDNMAGGDAMAGGANEMQTDEEKLPQGMTGAKAVAAGMGKDGNPVISVTATDTTCKANKTTVPAGTVWFKMTNKGTKFNELYLENAKAKELIQAPNVKVNQVGAFKWKVTPGKMMLACELQDKGKQIRVPITVTAAG